MACLLEAYGCRQACRAGADYEQVESHGFPASSATAAATTADVVHLASKAPQDRQRSS